MEIIIKLLVLFISCTLIIMAVHRCSFKEALCIALDGAKEIWYEVFGNPNPPITYPVYIGHDGNHIIYQLVDEVCQPLKDQFKVFYCNAFAEKENLVVYRFSVFPSIEVTDHESLTLLQKIGENILAEHFRRYDFYMPTATLTVVDFTPSCLFLCYAKNPAGIEEINAMKRRIRKRMFDISTQPASPFLEKWKDANPSKDMIWGYKDNDYRKYGIASPIRLSLKSHCHALITGASGSGKSTALQFLIGKRVQANEDTVIYICDFKNSEDFSYLKDYSLYYSGGSCYEGIMDYYQKFSKIRETGSNGISYLLICDEYPALINHLQIQDKLNKTKRANDILGAVAEILMLGRGLLFSVYIVTQRPDSSLFSNGARDNFMVVIALGKLSKEHRAMLFSGVELPDQEHTYECGEGLLLADGKEIQEVKYPLIEDVSDWEKHVLEHLMRNVGVCTDDGA